MTVRFKFNFDDTPGLKPIHDTLLNELNAAAAEWTKGLKGDGIINVAVHEGTFPNGGTAETFAQFKNIGQVDSQGKEVWVPVAELEANPHGTFPPEHSTAMNVTVDPKLLATNPDPVSLLAHELGHGLGFDGWIDGPSKSFDPKDLSTFDSHVQIVNGRFVFVGQYSGHVPLSDANPYHLDTAQLDTASHIDVMNAHVPGSSVTQLDFRVLADIGYDIDPFFLPSG